MHPARAAGLGPSRKSQPVEYGLHLKRNQTHIRPCNSWAGVEIDAQLVGMFEIAREHCVRMQFNASEVHYPDEAGGIIDGYRAEVNRQRAGLGLTVFVGLKVSGHSAESSANIERALLSIPAVVSCYLVSGTDDFLVEAVVPDLAGYEQFLIGQILSIPLVVEARSTFAIRTVLSRGPLPLDHWR